jgi:RNA polymerase sigma-70 factor (ECF subfamily)
MQRRHVELAISGDRAAFGQLVEGSIGRLFTLARLILDDPAAAEDATQDACVAAWRHIRGLRDPDRFDAWMHRLLVNACNREARRGHRRRRVEVHGAIVDTSAPDAIAHVAQRDELARGFLRLDVDQRAVLVLHHYLGLGLDEIAEELGVPPGTVRSRLHRGTRAMRAALDADARGRPVGQGRPA